MKQVFLYGWVLTAFLFGSCQKSFEERCADEARQVTETQCPRDLGEGVVLDSMVYQQPTNEFCYYYSVSGTLDNVDIFKKHSDKLVDVLRDQVTSSVELKSYKEHRMKFTYLYLSASSHKEFIRVSFTDKDYNF